MKSLPQMLPWDTPVKANGYRALELVELAFLSSGLRIVLLEEDEEAQWELAVPQYRAVCVTAEESAHEIYAQLLGYDAFWRAVDSPWLRTLGMGDRFERGTVGHYVVCCYDEVIEFASPMDAPSFRRLDEETADDDGAALLQR